MYMGIFYSKSKNNKIEIINEEYFKNKLIIDGDKKDIEKLLFIIKDYKNLIQVINKIDTRIYLEKLGLGLDINK